MGEGRAENPVIIETHEDICSTIATQYEHNFVLLIEISPRWMA